MRTTVALSNYIEAGSIIAIAVSLTAWQEAFGVDDFAIGLLAAVSANAFGAAGGAAVPASWTYFAEEAPSEDRARHVGTAQLAWSIGPAVGFALAIAVVPLGLLGNRRIFAHLFVVALVTWWLRQGLRESAAWTDRQEDTVEASSGRVRSLLGERRNVTALLFLFGVYGFWNLVAGQAGIFMPRVNESAGLSSAAGQNALQVLVWSCTALATWFGFMRLGDRVSRRALYIIGATLGVVAWALLSYAGSSVPVLLAFAVIWGTSAGIGAQAFYSVWASELFATQYRATAQGSCSSRPGSRSGCSATSSRRCWPLAGCRSWDPDARLPRDRTRRRGRLGACHPGQAPRRHRAGALGRPGGRLIR